ncbi:WD40-repeat-containing domain protein [Dipodascopsis tothii]|uniref:WD40-repeat-containing domain protein n=1 Tax=Dipodascopsis tothii TaxID=44089 RepID=UPI0034CEE23D
MNFGRVLLDRETRARSGIAQLYSARAFVNDMELTHQLYGHTGCVNTLCWSDDGTLLASGSDDTHVNVYGTDAAAYPLRARFATGHTANIFSVKFMPHSANGTVVTAAGDSQVRVFDLAGGEARRREVFKCYAERVKRIVPDGDSPNGFLTCSEDGDVRYIDLRSPQRYHGPYSAAPPPLISYRQYGIPLNALTLSPAQPQYLVLGGDHSYLFLHDRRFLARDIEQMWGMPPAANRATQCVRRFAPPGKRGHHVTSAKFSTARPNEVLGSWSAKGIFLFDIHAPAVPAAAPADDSRRTRGEGRGRGDDRGGSADSADSAGTSASATSASSSTTVEPRPRRATRKRRRDTDSSDERVAPPESERAAMAVAFGDVRSAFADGRHNECFLKAHDLLARYERYRLPQTAPQQRLYRYLVVLENVLRFWVPSDERPEEVLEAWPLRLQILRALAVLLAGEPPTGAVLAFPPGAVGTTAAVVDPDTAETLFTSEAEVVPVLRLESGALSDDRRSFWLQVARALLALEADCLTDDVVAAAFGAPDGQPPAEDPPHVSQETRARDARRRALSRGFRRAPRADDSDDSVRVSESEDDDGDDVDADDDVDLDMDIDLDFDDEDDQPWVRFGGRAPDKYPAEAEAGVPVVEPLRGFSGHCNVQTVKDVNFFGKADEYVVSGSDDGNVFVWDRQTAQLVQILRGDTDIVNVVQGHPQLPQMAVSGIDSTIKIFSPYSMDYRPPPRRSNLRSSAFPSLQPTARAWMSTSEFDTFVDTFPNSETRQSIMNTYRYIMLGTDPDLARLTEQIIAPRKFLGPSSRRMKDEYRIVERNRESSRQGVVDATYARHILTDLAARIHVDGDERAVLINEAEADCIIS